MKKEEIIQLLSHRTLSFHSTQSTQYCNCIDLANTINNAIHPSNVVFGNNAVHEHAAAANNATPLPTAAATSSLQMQKRKKGILQIRLHTVCSFVCSCNFLDVSLIHSVSISWKSSELSYTLSLLLWPWLRSLNSLSGQGCKDYSSHICKHCPTSNLAILGQLQICVWQNRKS